jgi:hypothetical protein
VGVSLKRLVNIQLSGTQLIIGDLGALQPLVALLNKTGGGTGAGTGQDCPVLLIILFFDNRIFVQGNGLINPPLTFQLSAKLKALLAGIVTNR